VPPLFHFSAEWRRESNADLEKRQHLPARELLANSIDGFIGKQQQRDKNKDKNKDTNKDKATLHSNMDIILQNKTRLSFLLSRVRALQTSMVDVLVGNFETVEQLKAGIDSAPPGVKLARVFVLHNTCPAAQDLQLTTLRNLLENAGDARLSNNERTNVVPCRAVYMNRPYKVKDKRQG
jgi:hypothetical protein